MIKNIKISGFDALINAITDAPETPTETTETPVESEETEAKSTRKKKTSK